MSKWLMWAATLAYFLILVVGCHSLSDRIDRLF